MFCVYITIRWYPPLRSTAIFLLVYVLAVIARETIIAYGRVILRLVWWLKFAQNDGVLKLAWSNVHTSASELAGFFLMAIIAPLFPLYLFACLAFAFHALRKRRSLGATLYFSVMLPVLRYKTPHRIRKSRNGNRFARVFSKFAPSAAEHYSSAEEDGNGNRYSSSGEETELDVSKSRTKRLRTNRTKRMRYTAIILINCVLLYLLVGFVYPPVKIILETLLFWLALVCVSVAIVFIGGTHVTIVFALSLEVVMVLKGIELETVRHEMIVWGCFLVPVCIRCNTWIFTRIIKQALRVLRQENGVDSRRTKLALVYHSIPVDAIEATHKMWDSLEKRGERPAERINKCGTFVVSLESNATIQDLRVALVEREDKRWNAEVV